MKFTDTERYNRMSKKPSFFFSKTFITILTLVIELAAIAVLIILLGKYFAWLYIIFEIVGILTALFVVNDKWNIKRKFKCKWKNL